MIYIPCSVNSINLAIAILHCGEYDLSTVCYGSLDTDGVILNKQIHMSALVSNMNFLLFDVLIS
jgi:hypothetical protein